MYAGARSSHEERGRDHDCGELVRDEKGGQDALFWTKTGEADFDVAQLASSCKNERFRKQPLVLRAIEGRSGEEGKN